MKPLVATLYLIFRNSVFIGIADGYIEIIWMNFLPLNVLFVLFTVYFHFAIFLNSLLCLEGGEILSEHRSQWHGQRVC